jgi:hypothetical protein
MAMAEQVTIRLSDRNLIQRMGGMNQKVPPHIAERLIGRNQATLVDGGGCVRMITGQQDKMIHCAPTSKVQTHRWEVTIFPESVIAA